MKKVFIAAAALAALAAGGAAMAQGDAQCQVNPASCSNWANSTPTYGYSGPNVYVQPGVRIAQGAWPYAYNRQYAQPQYPQYWQRAPYARTRRDRDGDGVPNWRDRYPDDPARY